MQWQSPDFISTTSHITLNLENRQLDIVEWKGVTIGTEETAQPIEVALLAFAPASVELARNVTYAFVASYHTSLETSTPRADALKDLESVANDFGLGSDGRIADTSKVRPSHETAWKHLWQSNLTVE